MTRPYGVKGRKRKQAEPKYDREKDEDEPAQPKQPTLHNKQEEEEEEEEEAAAPAEPSKEPAEENEELAGIPIAPTELKTDKPSVIFILEKASLEVAKVGKVVLQPFPCCCCSLILWPLYLLLCFFVTRVWKFGVELDCGAVAFVYCIRLCYV